MEIAINEGLTITYTNNSGDARQFLNEQLYEQYGLEDKIITLEEDEEQNSKYFIAKHDHMIVGAGRLSLNPPEEMIEESGLYTYLSREFYERIVMFRGFAVLPSYRGKGLGTKLYKIREQAAIQHGKKIGLSLIRTGAFSIYRNAGYMILKNESLPMELQEKIGQRRWVFKYPL